MTSTTLASASVNVIVTGNRVQQHSDLHDLQTIFEKFILDFVKLKVVRRNASFIQTRRINILDAASK